MGNVYYSFLWLPLNMRTPSKWRTGRSKPGLGSLLVSFSFIRLLYPFFRLFGCIYLTKEVCKWETTPTCTAKVPVNHLWCPRFPGCVPSQLQLPPGVMSSSHTRRISTQEARLWFNKEKLSSVNQSDLTVNSEWSLFPPRLQVRLLWSLPLCKYPLRARFLAQGPRDPCCGGKREARPLPARHPLSPLGDQERNLPRLPLPVRAFLPNPALRVAIENTHGGKRIWVCGKGGSALPKASRGPVVLTST